MYRIYFYFLSQIIIQIHKTDHTLNSILLCGNGGKWAISVARGVCGTGRRREPYFARDWNCLPARAIHTIFCHASAFIDHIKGNALCRHNILMFCKDCGIDFSVWLCRVCPTLLGISIYSRALWGFPLNRPLDEKGRFTSLKT